MTPMARTLDGNAVAGQLGELFALEITAATSRCAGCGATAPVAALAAYTDGPGAVLRCPRCEAVILRLVRGPRRLWLDLRGAGHLEFQVPD
ncbi:MAG TPA: DUF6510 family protein [Candidatus Dormibacteraeota bacterium]